MEKSGLIVHPAFSYLGASPDGLINPDALLEIKCPYNGRNSKIGAGKDFPFLQESREGLALKKGSHYYCQVMGQLALSERKRCYFTVFTFEDLFVQEIEFDSAYFHQEMLPKLQEFYYTVYRPYVAGKL